MTWFNILKKRTKRKKRVGMQQHKAAFINRWSPITVELTGHVHSRFQTKMGWNQAQMQSMFPNDTFTIPLNEGILETTYGGWKITVGGLGIFVIVRDKPEKKWVAVTFYPENIW